jgi:hypothetical protein
MGEMWVKIRSKRKERSFMSQAAIHIDELTREQRRELGLRKPRQSRFSADELRGWSLKILALMSSLTRAERERVLRHAQKVNRV